MPAQNKSGASSVSDFKKGPKAIELPSGNRMVLKKAGLQALVASGTIPNELLGPVQSEIDKGKGRSKKPNPFDVANKLDAGQMQQMLDMMENVVVMCAVEPRVHPIPRDESGNLLPIDFRNPEVLYVDELEEEDRMFIFQYVTGGTKDLASFRAELSGLVATVSGREDVAVPAV